MATPMSQRANGAPHRHSLVAAHHADNLDKIGAVRPLGALPVDHNVATVGTLKVDEVSVAASLHLAHDRHVLPDALLGRRGDFRQPPRMHCASDFFSTTSGGMRVAAWGNGGSCKRRGSDHAQHARGRAKADQGWESMLARGATCWRRVLFTRGQGPSIAATCTTKKRPRREQQSGQSRPGERHSWAAQAERTIGRKEGPRSRPEGGDDGQFWREDGEENPHHCLLRWPVRLSRVQNQIKRARLAGQRVVGSQKTSVDLQRGGKCR